MKGWFTRKKSKRVIPKEGRWSRFKKWLSKKSKTRTTLDNNESAESKNRHNQIEDTISALYCLNEKLPEIKYDQSYSILYEHANGKGYKKIGNLTKVLFNYNEPTTIFDKNVTPNSITFEGTKGDVTVGEKLFCSEFIRKSQNNDINANMCEDNHCLFPITDGSDIKIHDNEMRNINSVKYVDYGGKEHDINPNNNEYENKVCSVILENDEKSLNIPWQDFCNIKVLLKGGKRKPLRKSRVRKTRKTLPQKG